MMDELEALPMLMHVLAAGADTAPNPSVEGSPENVA
jgi:hypothetical protein